MELTWFQSLIYGLISGFTEFLPISAVAHQAIFVVLTGAKDNGLLRLSVHFGSLLALIIAFTPTLSRLRRERKIANTPKKRRHRQPDFAAMMELRLLRMAAVSMLLVFAGYGAVYNLYERLWLLALLLGLNGIMLYLPQYMRGANKGPESMSSLDGMLIGLSAGLGVVPGLSRFGFGTSVALIRGAERQFATEIGLLLGLPGLIAFMLMDSFSLFGAGIAFSGMLVLGCVTAAAAAFAAAYLAIFLARFLAVRVGYSGFAYYCWGMALLSLILYLI